MQHNWPFRCAWCTQAVQVFYVRQVKYRSVRIVVRWLAQHYFIQKYRLQTRKDNEACLSSLQQQYTSNVTAITKVWSASFGLVLHAQQIFANSSNFLVTWGLPFIVFHSTCILCTAVQGMRVCIVCLPVCCTPGECYYNTLLCWDYFSSTSVVLHIFSALCMYSKFGHHPHR